ncbi:septum formation initiator precursor [Amylibacter kogurei]|uniref:Septum formation initiator n=1 Tax=Paramylibacter kogurei TaxID=1889778 RepID=A0A2G5K5Y7_9RHOB|nr:septum formation initiator family protein [Amylibacter kogurei]PIB24948.1 septum formation initiator precursor [Amylibacter kogurei]
MKVIRNSRIGLGAAIFFAAILSLSAYFVFAAIQGDFGHFQRVQIEAEEQLLTQQLAELRKQREGIANKTHRMSDDYLDLDLLDEQARKLLGMARPDEVIIR